MAQTRNTGKRTGGRKKWRVTPTVLRKIERLASQFMNVYQIAECFGVSYETFHRRYPDGIEDAIVRGRSKGLDLVTAKNMTLIRKGDKDQIRFTLARVAGWVEQRSYDLTVRADQAARDAAVKAALGAAQSQEDESDS